MARDMLLGIIPINLQQLQDDFELTIKATSQLFTNTNLLNEIHDGLQTMIQRNSQQPILQKRMQSMLDVVTHLQNKQTDNKDFTLQDFQHLAELSEFYRAKIKPKLLSFSVQESEPSEHPSICQIS